jgi:antitoxin component YwqK of YwqJK toxin-antitoxin module
MSLLGVLLLAMLGCVTAKRFELNSHVEYYADGELKLRYTFYVKDGHEVLHGKKEVWQPNGRLGTIEEYKNGVKIGTYQAAINP